MTRGQYRGTRKKQPTIHDLTYEHDFQATIIDACLRYRYKAHHMYDSRLCAEGSQGFPDLAITGHRQLIFWECKAEGETPTTKQEEWLAALRQVEGPPRVEVIKPSDLNRCLETLKYYRRR